MEMADSCKEGFTFTLYTREGEWGERKTDEVYDVNTMSENHIANVPKAPAVSAFTVIIHGDYEVEGVDTANENGFTVFRISKETHEASTLSFRAVKK